MINLNLKYMNIKDFIDNILENCKTQSEKGFIFERLFDIFNHLRGNAKNFRKS
jgi:hypothetical protein